jgi:hypothetical protein
VAAWPEKSRILQLGHCALIWIAKSIPEMPGIATRSVTGAIQAGIIGKRDLTLHPMIPAGSIVQIDTQKAGNLNSKKLDLRIPAAHLFPDDSGRLCLRLVRVGQKLRLADVDTAFAIAGPKQEMEVQDRSRKHRACHHGGHANSKLTIVAEQQRCRTCFSA